MSEKKEPEKKNVSEEDLKKANGGAAPYGYWQCSKCTQYNSHSLIKCSNCGRPR